MCIAQSICRADFLQQAARYGDANTRVSRVCGQHAKPEDVITCMWRCAEPGCGEIPTHYEGTIEFSRHRKAEGAAEVHSRKNITEKDLIMGTRECSSHADCETIACESEHASTRIPLNPTDKACLACEKHRSDRHVPLPKHGVNRRLQGRVSGRRFPQNDSKRERGSGRVL